MKAKDIIIGKSYRHKDHPNYCYVKALQILKPREGENTNTFIVVKCEYTVEKDSSFRLIKYFKPSNLIEEHPV